MQRNFTAPAPDKVWLTDITEHWTDQGKLYACVIKDVCSNRIVGHATSDRMTAASPPRRCALRSPGVNRRAQWWSIRTGAASFVHEPSEPC